MQSAPSPAPVGGFAREAHSSLSVRDLGLVLAVALGFRLLWAVLIPPWLSPDEPSHFTYVAHLVEQHEIPHEPSQNAPYPTFSSEVAESFELTQYYRLSRKGGRRRPELAYLPLKHDYGAVLGHNAAPELRRSAAGASATPYPPLYYAIVGLGYRAFSASPLLARLFATRAISALLGALACCFGYLFAHELRRDAKLSLAVGLGMALLPMHVFMSASVNNDAGLFLMASVLCWLMARTATAPRLTPGLALGVGTTSSLMLLIKPTSAALALLAAAFLLWRVLKAGDKQSGFARALLFAAYGAPVVVIYGGWLLYRQLSPEFSGPQAYSQEGDLVSSILHAQHSPWSYLRFRWNSGPAYAMKIFVREVLGSFGWRELNLPRPTFALVILGYAGAAVGLALQIRRRRAERAKSLLAMALVATQVAFIFVVADYALCFASRGVSIGIQGRYFLPVAAPMFFLIFLGWYELCGSRRWVWTVMPIVMLLVQLVGLHTILATWYGLRIG